VNVRVGIRRILFGVFALNWIMKLNPMNPLAYIVEHHMFEKNIKIQKSFILFFL